MERTHGKLTTENNSKTQMQGAMQQEEVIQMPELNRSASETQTQTSDYCEQQRTLQFLVLADTKCSKQHCYSEISKPRLEQKLH